MQRAHRLLDGHDGVETVDLEEVDVRGVEALEGALDSVEDRRAREAGVVDVLGRVEEVGLNQGELVGVAADDVCKAVSDSWREVSRNTPTVALRRDDHLVAGDVVLLKA